MNQSLALWLGISRLLANTTTTTELLNQFHNNVLTNRLSNYLVVHLYTVAVSLHEGVTFS